MTLNELEQLCAEAKAMGLSHVTVTLPPRQFRGEKIRLLPRAGPLCEVLCVNRAGKIVVRAPLAGVARLLKKLRAEQSKEKGQ